MNWFWTAIVTGITTFIATNIDDIIILMLFFSQLNRQLTVPQIVMGQYLGFTALILASLVGFLGGLIIPKIWIGLLGFVPLLIGIKGLFREEDEDSDIQDVNLESPSSEPKNTFKKWLSLPLIKVAAVTIANGGDNIGIYVPLFASTNLASLTIILAVFYSLIGVWCAIAYWLTRHPTLAQFLTHQGKKITPWVFISLGIYILIENESYRLLPWFR